MRGEKLTIVLVDDAADVRALVRMRLRLDARFEVVGEAGTGREAVEVVRSTMPDLLLLDMSMPDMDGIDALVQVTELSPATRVVVFSGFEEQGLADRARALGAADFVEKSLPIDQLAERLVAVAADDPAPDVLDGPPEALLQEHLERFRAVFDEAAIGMATLTLTGRIVRANRALLHMTKRDDLVGVGYEELTDREHRGAVAEATGVVAEGERDSIAVEHGIGEAGAWVVSTLAVIRDSDGRPLYLFLQTQDVSELRRSEERFRLLVSSVADYAIFMLDPDGRIASWNLGAERAKGYTADEAIGQHFSIFYPPEARASDHPAMELAVATAEGRFEEEGWRVRKDGSVFWANVVITALRDASGKLIGFAKVTRDMSERRRLLEELSTVAEERSQFMAVTAHELRTPVAVVNGFATTLRDHWGELPDGERQDMVAAVARGGERLTRLVEDLLTAARLDAGAVEILFSSFDLGEVVSEVAADLGDGGVTVAGEGVRVRADRGRVAQMVGNYLTNALRYGRPPVSASISVEGGAAVLRVRDQGPGVAEGLQGRLFGKFQQGGGHEGTGLGLFIVRQLAQVQGGDAWYEPQPAGGACFALRLPLDA